MNDSLSKTTLNKEHRSCHNYTFWKMMHGRTVSRGFIVHDCNILLHQLYSYVNDKTKLFQSYCRCGHDKLCFLFSLNAMILGGVVLLI